MKKSIFIALLSIVVLGLAALWFFNNKNQPALEVTEFWQEHNPNSHAEIDHSQWQEVLDEYVVTDDESGVYLVDYEVLSEDASLLDTYINYLIKLNPKDYNKNEQMAYWINLYNALTVQLIVSNYPVGSITNLGESALSFGPWDDIVTTVSAQALSLNHIEHSILRPIWKDPRIHFAVNCASIGCPNLQGTAFTAENLESLLNLGAQDYLNHERGLYLDEDNNTLYLSSIFKWYAEDFGADEAAVIKALASYLPGGALKDQLTNFDGSVEYDYNWELNGI